MDRMVGAAELFGLGTRTMAGAERGRCGVAWREAVAFRDGLMIALLATRPVRRRNLAAMEMGRHLTRRGASYWLSFGAAETKGGRALEFPLPAALAPALERYLAVHRPVLLSRAGDAGTTARLWVSATGSAMGEAAIYGRIVKLTRTAFGAPVNPHLFRDCAATSIALEGPAHVRITREILGHGAMATSERHYNHAGGLAASRDYQAHVQRLRDQARTMGGKRIKRRAGA